MKSVYFYSFKFAFRYSVDFFQFGEVDLSQWPQAAQIYSVNDPPTFILFENGVEMKRLGSAESEFADSIKNIFFQKAFSRDLYASLSNRFA